MNLRRLMVVAVAAVSAWPLASAAQEAESSATSNHNRISREVQDRRGPVAEIWTISNISSDELHASGTEDQGNLRRAG
jgi:hypothetical protein